MHILGPEAADNKVLGNFIGVAADGTTPLGNAENGVTLEDAHNNTIGGDSAAARNIISGNGASGIVLSASNSNVIAGNFIGTDVDGTAKLPNVDGVWISGANGNLIGGVTDNARNVISGNSRFGITLASTFGDATLYNEVKGNYIGTDASGMSALGNTTAGIALVSDHHSIIGGTEPGAGNVISGNGPHGIWMYGGNGNQNIRVQGNLIGTSADGQSAIPNWRGISIYGAHIMVLTIF